MRVMSTHTSQIAELGEMQDVFTGPEAFRHCFTLNDFMLFF